MLIDLLANPISTPQILTTGQHMFAQARTYLPSCVNQKLSNNNAKLIAFIIYNNNQLATKYSTYFLH